MAHRSNRREFIRDLGISAAAVPVHPELAQPGIRESTAAQAAAGHHVQPQRRVPSAFWPDEEGPSFKLKESLKPLEPFRDRTLILHGVCDKLRGDGDNHMRGMGCLLTGIELFPGNIQGGSDTPAGWAKGLSIDQEIKNALQARSETRTRFGSLEFGVMVPDRADTWTRMVYAGPNKPIAPIDDPYQMFAKLYGRMKDQESLKSILDDLQDDLHKVELGRELGRSASCWKSMRRSCARWSRSLRTAEQPGRRPCGPRARAGREARNGQHAQDQQDADRPHGQQLRRRLRPGGDLAIHQFGRRGQDALARCHRGPPRAVSPPGQRQEVAGKADQDQQVVLRADGLPGEAAGGDARAGRRRQPARQHADRLDQRARQGQLAHA